MARARRRLAPRTVGLCAVVLMAVGTVLCAVFASVQAVCIGPASSPLAGIAKNHARCAPYSVGAGIGVGVLALGTALVVLAVVLTLPAFRPDAAPGDAGETDAPAEGPDALAVAGANGKLAGHGAPSGAVRVAETP